MNLNPINDKKFAPADAMSIGSNDEIAFKQKYFGRLMSGMMHYTSANVSSERETVGFFKTTNGDFSCKIDRKDIPVLERWGSQSDLLVEGYIFYGHSFTPGKATIFLTGCKIMRKES